MFKLLIHLARSSENGLERRLRRVQDKSSKLHADSGLHMEFLNDAMIELQSRMARAKQVRTSAGKLIEANSE